MGNRNSFTLIEFLVVIAIISILTGMLLPALSKARKTAKNIACVSNLKQHATITHSYTVDFDGYMPYAKSTAGEGSWFYNSDGFNDPVFYKPLIVDYAQLASDYTKYSGIFKCIGADELYIEKQGFGRKNTYRTNTFFNCGFRPYNGGQHRPGGRKMSSIPKPAESMTYFDTWWYNWSPDSLPHARGINTLYVEGHVGVIPTAQVVSQGAFDDELGTVRLQGW